MGTATVAANWTCPLQCGVAATPAAISAAKAEVASLANFQPPPTCVAPACNLDSFLQQSLTGMVGKGLNEMKSKGIGKGMKEVQAGAVAKLFELPLLLDLPSPEADTLQGNHLGSYAATIALMGFITLVVVLRRGIGTPARAIDV